MKISVHDGFMIVYPDGFRKNLFTSICFYRDDTPWIGTGNNNQNVPIDGRTNLLRQTELDYVFRHIDFPLNFENYGIFRPFFIRTYTRKGISKTLVGKIRKEFYNDFIDHHVVPSSYFEEANDCRGFEKKPF